MRKVDYTYEDCLYDLITSCFWINGNGHLDWSYSDVQENPLFDTYPQIEKDILELLRQRGIPAKMMNCAQ